MATAAGQAWCAGCSLVSVLCTQLGHTTDSLSISSVSRALDAQIQVHTSSHTVSTNCYGCPRLQGTETSRAGKSATPTLSPGGTQVRVLSRVSPQASWEIYCPGNEGRDRLRKRRRREEKGEVRKKRKMEKRKHGERKRGEEG